MTALNLTRIVIAVTIVALIVFDLVIVVRCGQKPTISAVILESHLVYPWIGFVAGIVVGHLFFPQYINK